MNQIDLAQRIINLLLKEEGWRKNFFLSIKIELNLVANNNYQHAQQVTKAYEILANIAEQNKQFEETKSYLATAKENQKKLLKRIQLEDADFQKENKKLYCK